MKCLGRASGEDETVAASAKFARDRRTNAGARASDHDDVVHPAIVLARRKAAPYDAVSRGALRAVAARFADQIRRSHCGRAGFEQIVEMRLPGPRVGDHQLDEADDHREVVAEEVDVVCAKRDRSASRHVCTQFVGHWDYGRGGEEVLSAGPLRTVGQFPTNIHENRPSC